MTWKLRKSYDSSNRKRYSSPELGTTGYVTGVCYRYSLVRNPGTLEGIGKDYMKYVEFSDVLTLPDGFAWNEKIKQEVDAGRVYLDMTGMAMEGGNSDPYAKPCGFYCVIDGKKYSIASLSSFASYYKDRLDLKDWKVSFITGVNGKEKLRLDWKVHNKDMSTEIDNISSYQLTYGPRLIQFNMEEVKEGTKHLLHNEITADETFCYSENQKEKTIDEEYLYMGAAKLKIWKNESGGDRYGSRIDFTLKAINDGGYPYTTYQKMEDTLPDLFYIEPENLETMFAAESFGSDALTVTISKASLHKPLNLEKKDVIRSDGSSGTQLRQELISSGAQAEEVKQSSF